MSKTVSLEDMMDMIGGISSTKDLEIPGVIPSGIRSLDLGVFGVGGLPRGSTDESKHDQAGRYDDHRADPGAPRGQASDLRQRQDRAQKPGDGECVRPWIALWRWRVRGHPHLQRADLQGPAAP